MNVLDTICKEMEEEGKAVFRPEHPDCEKCCHNMNGNCSNYRYCREWREWFAAEWHDIKEAARRMSGKTKGGSKKGKAGSDNGTV
jgi:hypothetical protein